MKHVLKKIFVLLLFFMITLSFYDTTEANQVGFSVDPKFPSNQLDKDSGYFHIQLKPGNKQQLSIELKNYTDKEITLKTTVASATTNVNGVVDYTPTTNKTDNSLPVDLSKLIKIDKEIVLAANETKQVPVFVSMTNEFVPGVIASGISFEEINSTNQKSLINQTTVNNKFSYVLALLMQQEASLDVQPELNLGKVMAKGINTKTSISAYIRNVAPAYLNQVKIESTLTKKGEDKPFYQYKKENMQLSPNSVFEFPTFLNGKKLESGEYTYKAVISGVTAELNNEEREKLTWELEDVFHVEKKRAKELNDHDYQVETTKETSTKWLMLAIVLNIVLITSFVSYIFFKKKKSSN